MADPIASAVLEELDRLERAATPAPWQVAGEDLPACVVTAAKPDENLLVWNEEHDLAEFPTPADAALTAATRTHLRPLLDEARQAREMREVLHDLLSNLREQVAIAAADEAEPVIDRTDRYWLDRLEFALAVRGVWLNPGNAPTGSAAPVARPDPDRPLRAALIRCVSLMRDVANDIEKSTGPFTALARDIHETLDVVKLAETIAGRARKECAPR